MTVVKIIIAVSLIVALAIGVLIYLHAKRA